MDSTNDLGGNGDSSNNLINVDAATDAKDLHSKEVLFDYNGASSGLKNEDAKDILSVRNGASSGVTNDNDDSKEVLTVYNGASSGVTNNDSKEYPVESSKSNEFKNNEAQRSTIEDIRTPNNTNNGNYDEIQVKPLLNASQSYIYFYLGISRPAGQDCDRSIIIF
jgi:hypothetical protein